jgi:hypothetical protein
VFQRRHCLIRVGRRVFFGRLVASLAGNLIDRSLCSGSNVQRSVEGPQLADLDIMASTEDAPIARVYPVFPASVDVWSDGPSWENGHWLTGRLGSSPLEGLIATILTDSGTADFNTEA